MGSLSQRKGVAPKSTGSASAAAGVHTDNTNQDAPNYKHRSPVLLLSAFAVSFIVVAWCAYTLFAIKANTHREQNIQKQQSAVQLTKQRQEELNRHTRQNWELYAEHRGNVTKYIRELAKASDKQSPSK
jgi:hypothetical protein